ncbi:alpha/beta hydrolase [Nocardioides sp. TRM66260-LWL]|uniref:alpha/beta hydrolase n=1 Tax=Nocardioides sp. TRM66260-LWL TaxID=2874478 RepID=UPI001CC4763A|nr:alpha/beta hydrolase [Nocardioides sp. TRM66260-LWL]MBZ5734765.1 alpha/beta hydrolase [Nocardioides sp. TRM66260-LWL]
MLNIRSQHDDWRAALAYARRLPGVDAGRLVLWGTSFGGGHALRIASEDRGVAAVIAQVPHVSGPASVFSQPPRLVARLIAAGLRDQARAAVGRAPYRVPAAGYPGDLAMMTSPDAAPMAIRLAGDLYEQLLPANDVAARIALRVPFYSPGRRAAKVLAPTLVQIASGDTVTPVEVALKAGRRLPDGEIRTYECQHFEPYLDPYFETVVGDQLDFLRRRVPSGLA